MSEDPNTRPVAPTETPVPAAEAERASAREPEPLLARAKQAVITAVEEAIRKYGGGMVAEARQALQAAIDAVVAAQVEKLVQQFGPGGDAAKRATEGWLRETREFAHTTLAELFETRVPAYSSWVGQRVIDYALVGVLFAVAVMLLFAGGILGLRELGVPSYAALLAGGVVALGFGFWLLRVRRGRPAAPAAAGPASERPVRPPGG